MPDQTWDEGELVEVPAKPAHGNWTKAIEYVDAPKRLKFVVDDMRVAAPAAAPAGGGGGPAPAPPQERNQWAYLQNRTCGADGEPKAPVNPASCLIPDAPPGALIAKIGGSIAGKTSDAIESFIVGSFCVIDLDEKSKGTLYLTMNADPMADLERVGNLAVKIHRSR